MSLFKAFCIAFSIYSKLPMPQFEWKEEDMRYHLIFFPWIGAVIGGLLYAWGWLCRFWQLPELTFVLVATAIPLIVTGGFHVDGFMDTMDAWKSYKSKEEKLKILKDPHIGAFAVIMLALYGLIYMAAVSAMGAGGMAAFSISFVLARVLSAITVLSFPSAKSEGMLHTFSESADSKKGTVKLVLYVELMLCAGLLLWDNLFLGMGVLITSGVWLFFYYKKTKKELGGITGDTAGYFVTCMEVLTAVVCAVYSQCIR